MGPSKDEVGGGTAINGVGRASLSGRVFEFKAVVIEPIGVLARSAGVTAASFRASRSGDESRYTDDERGHG